jgi:hypothetical protein
MANEIINNDSIKLATAAANSDNDAVKKMYDEISGSHPYDDQKTYWNGVREGANHILREAYPQRTSSVGDALRSALPMTGEGSSKFAQAQIEHNGSINFSSTPFEQASKRASEIMNVNTTAEKEQKGQR